MSSRKVHMGILHSEILERTVTFCGRYVPDNDFWLRVEMADWEKVTCKNCRRYPRGSYERFRQRPQPIAPEE